MTIHYPPRVTDTELHRVIVSLDEVRFAMWKLFSAVARVPEDNDIIERFCDLQTTHQNLLSKAVQLIDQ